LKKYLKFSDDILGVSDKKMSRITNYYLVLIELSDHIFYTYIGGGYAVAHLVEALCYKLGGRWFSSWWDHSGLTMAL